MGSLAIATSPWRFLLLWVSWWAGRFLSLLTYLGVKPVGFLPSSKYKELTRIVEHLHSREDAFRNTIRELQDKVDAGNMDKRKALRKLKFTLAELEATHQRLAAGETLLPDYPALNAAPPGSPSKAGLHASVAVLATSVWWFYSQDHPAIQRKVVFAVLFPLAWAYLASLGSRRPHLTLLCCACWFLTGFVAAHRLSVAQASV